MYHYTMSARLKCDSGEVAAIVAAQGGKTTSGKKEGIW